MADIDDGGYERRWVDQQGDGWGGSDDDLDLPSDEDAATGEEGGEDGAASYYVVPSAGTPVSQYWASSPLVADHVAAGEFEVPGDPPAPLGPDQGPPATAGNARGCPQLAE